MKSRLPRLFASTPNGKPGERGSGQSSDFAICRAVLKITFD